MMRIKFGISAFIILAIAIQVARGQIVTMQNHKIMIFGGEDHKVYLGCLSCTQYASDSVQNEYGRYGSQYQSESVLNPYGAYGSPYSNNSPCNPYATEPPVIVDEDGNFYGRLTVNKFHAQITRSQVFQNWIEGICGNQ